MKKFILFPALFIFIISFYGCPYLSKVAIDSPSIKVDKSYLGTWSVKSGETKYEVTKLDEFHLKITLLPSEKDDVKANKDDDNQTIYHAFFSKVNDVSFINLCQISKYDEPGKKYDYYLYKFETKGKNEIVLTEVTSNIKEKFSTSEKLKAYIEKYMDLSFFFGAESVYIREQ